MKLPIAFKFIFRWIASLPPMAELETCLWWFFFTQICSFSCSVLILVSWIFVTEFSFKGSYAFFQALASKPWKCSDNSGKNCPYFTQQSIETGNVKVKLSLTKSLVTYSTDPEWLLFATFH